jgi:hypothetical protein
MVINDFNLRRIGALPNEAEATLVIDPDAVLALATPFSASKALPGERRSSSDFAS